MSARGEQTREGMIKAWTRARDAARAVLASCENELARFRGPDHGFDTVPLAAVADALQIDVAATPPPDATPTRATMRPPAPAFTPRPAARERGTRTDKRASDETVARVRAVLTPPPGNSPGWIAEKTGLAAATVRRALRLLMEDGAVERSGGKQGLNVRYALKGNGAAPVEAAPAASKAGEKIDMAATPAVPGHACAKCGGPRSKWSSSLCRQCYTAKSEAPRPAKANPFAKPAPAPPLANANGKAPELNGALKVVAADILKWLQLQPMTLDEVQRRTGWPMHSLKIVADHLKAAGEIRGDAKFRLKGEEE